MADPIRITQRGIALLSDSKAAVLGLTLLALMSAMVIGRVDVRSDFLPGASAGVEPETAQLDDPAQVASPMAAPAKPAVQRESVRHGMLADFLAKRYRVSRHVIMDFVSHAYSAGQVTRIDPLLILAVMAVESGFNPIAESVMGAKGLMQVIPRYHPEKFVADGGEVNVLDPATNILAGAKVLREYIARTGDDLGAALGLYAGAGPVAETPYAIRVLSERERLEQLLSQPGSRAPQR